MPRDLYLPGLPSIIRNLDGQHRGGRLRGVVAPRRQTRPRPPYAKQMKDTKTQRAMGLALLYPKPERWEEV